MAKKITRKECGCSKGESYVGEIHFKVKRGKDQLIEIDGAVHVHDIDTMINALASYFVEGSETGNTTKELMIRACAVAIEHESKTKPE